MPHQPDFASAQAYALQRLQDELPPELTYHSLQHTRDDVVPATERLAAMENVTATDLMLLLTAAYFHDIGFVIRRDEHEAESMRIAAAILPTFGYDAAQIEIINAMIQATRLPQLPRHHLDEILADADLDSLGRQDFWARSLALRLELSHFGEKISDREWYQRQIRFLGAHHYFTASARGLRDAQKQRNLDWLVEQLACLD